MKKSVKKSKCAKWIIRMIIFVGRALLIVADYLDDCQMNGSSQEMFNRVKSMFSLPDDKDDDEQTTESNEKE